MRRGTIAPVSPNTGDAPGGRRTRRERTRDEGRQRLRRPGLPGTPRDELLAPRDGRVLSGGDDKRVLVWDPAAPETGPVELGGHNDSVRALAVLPGGRVVSGGLD
jgi:hypothetical protein